VPLLLAVRPPQTHRAVAVKRSAPPGGVARVGASGPALNPAGEKDLRPMRRAA
jgi:hypothetical protein